MTDNQLNQQDQSQDSPIPSSEIDHKWLEVANLSDYFTQYGQGASLYDIKLKDLYRYLRNPHANIESIIKASKYLTNKHGLIKDILRSFKSLPTLNYHLNWSSFDDPKKIQKYEKRIYDFLENLNVKKMTRDGLFEVGEIGTIVPCLRDNKYIQFLDMDDLRINRMRNGKWVVEYDLKTLEQYGHTLQDKMRIIESLPNEVTARSLIEYKKNGESSRYVELSNCDVINIDGNRNFPYGLPLTFGAWTSLLQKEIINRVERSVADRLIKQVLILYAGEINAKSKDPKPAPKGLIEGYFKQVSNLMQQKEGNSKHMDESSGTGVIAMPDFMQLKALDVNTDMFTKDLYSKINNDIFMNLGVSSSLVYGGGDSNYSSSSVNSGKFFRYIFTVLEDFERVINGYIKQLLPNNLSCKFYFDKTTILDQKEHIANCKEFYMQTGVVQPWAESLTGVPLHYVLGQAKYEKEVLKTQDVLYPPLNAHTSSGKGEPGNPGDPNSQNENTNKTRSNGANNSPSPST